MSIIYYLLYINIIYYTHTQKERETWKHVIPIQFKDNIIQ